jgi:eukaryotic-like serine/threonine-protein kinase
VFNQDRTIIATGSADHTTRLWKISDPANPTQLSTLRTLTPATMLTGHTNYVCCVAFNPADKGRFLATASHDATSRYYDVLDPLNPVPVTDFVNPKGATPIVPGATDHDAMRWVSFSPDGRVLATCGTLGTASVDHVVRLWDLADPVAHQVLAEFPNGIGGTWCAVFSPDGETLATVGEDHTIRLWNVSDPGHPTLTATLPGHTDVTQTLAYSPDGKLLASGSRDKTARLWNVADPKTPTAAAKLEGHAANVGSVAFSPDGKLLATASDDKTARIWRLG